MRLYIISQFDLLIWLLLLAAQLCRDGRPIEDLDLVILGLLFLLLGSLVRVEHPLLELVDVALPITLQLLLIIFAHLLLRLVVQRFDLIDFVHVENIIVANFLQEFEKQGALCLRTTLRHPLVQVRIQIRLLHDLPDDVSVSDRLHIQIVALSELCVFDSLLSEGELEHLNSPDKVVVDVLLGLELRAQLVDTRNHLLLFENEFRFSLISCLLLLSQEVNDAVHGNLFAHQAGISLVPTFRTSLIIVVILVVF